MTNKYSVLMASAKLAARDILRSRWTANLLVDLQSLTECLENLTKTETSAKFELSVALFDASQATKEGDPRAELLAKDATAAQADYDAEMKSISEERTATQKTIDETNKQISDVATGVLKVSYENMTTLAKEIAQERIKESFKNGAFELSVGSN